MVDLRTTYMGLPLASPLVHSASPLSRDLDMIRRLEDAGASAIVMYSLFEEEIEQKSLQLDHFLDFGNDHYAESLGYFPDFGVYDAGADHYLEQVRLAKEATGVPVIGSLNGISDGGWVEYARKIEQAGADGLELNLYSVPADPRQAGADIEAEYVRLVSRVRAEVHIPIAVKLSPFFTNPTHIARRFDELGVEAIVLFNRFYQPDIDLELLEIQPSLRLSNSDELALRLRWAAIFYGNVWADLAITGGVHTGEDVLKCMMVGAKVAMMTSAVLRHGPEHFKTIRAQVVEWMLTHDYVSIEQMQGSLSLRSIKDPTAFERSNYMKTLQSYRP